MTLGEALAVAVAVVGLPFSWWIGRRARRTPQLRHAVDFHALITPSSGLLNEGLVLDFNGQTVSRVSWTAVAFWNAGGDHIDREDALETDPLRIVFPDGDAPLRARVASASRPQIGVEPTIVGDSVRVDFAFLAAGDGAILEILHRGSVPPKVAGTIKSASMSGPVRADLSSGVLDALGSPRLRGRLRARLARSLSRERNPRFLIATIVFVGVAVGLLCYVLLSEQLHSPRLLQVSQYRLNTLEGQRAFANDQRQFGLPPAETWVVVPLVVGLYVVAAIRTLLGRGSPIPRSILAWIAPR